MPVSAAGGFYGALKGEAEIAAGGAEDQGAGAMYDFQEPEDFDPRLSMHPRGFPWGFCAAIAALIAIAGVLLWAGGAFAHEIPGMHDHTTYPTFVLQ
jgi:hypothetical protein